MTSKSQPTTKSGKFTAIPLNKLKKSPHNVRKMPHSIADIEALAASIAANGLLQNLIVEPETDKKGKPTGFHLVTAGEGRRLAHLLLAKRKIIDKDAPVRCMIETEGNHHEISLAENIVRSSMHPADQYEAFAQLHHDDGLSAEDIAARFGVSPQIVMQRLKLGAVSPALRDLYRNGAMNLDQLTAFTITDDHARQERVWQELPSFNRNRAAIMQALSEGQIEADDRRARFIGAEVYQAAGGAITHDLFEPDGGFFADGELLNRLVAETLKIEADRIAQQGWKWVEAAPEFDYERTSQLRRIYPQSKPLTDEEQERCTELEEQHNAITEACEDEPSEEDAEALEKIEAELAALEGESQFTAAQMAMAGVLISLNHDGGLRIEKGYLRPEDAKVLATYEKESETNLGKADANAPAPLSEKLVAELTAHRTAALRNEVALHPDVAMTALLHALVLASFYPHYRDDSCLRITATSPSLERHVANIPESRAGREINERHQMWAQRLPEEPQALWTAIDTMEAADRVRLMAHCAGMTLDATRENSRAVGNGRLQNADVIAHAVSLDMRNYWQADPATYLGRVSKDRILEAVREAVTPEAADNLSKLKKQAMAEAATLRIQDTGWLPIILRAPHVEPLACEDIRMAAE